MSAFRVWLFRLRYWRPSERRALADKLEFAVETGVIRLTADAMGVWNREVPPLFRHDFLLRQRLWLAFDTRMDYQRTGDGWQA